MIEVAIMHISYIPWWRLESGQKRCWSHDQYFDNASEIGSDQIQHLICWLYLLVLSALVDNPGTTDPDVELAGKPVVETVELE